MRLISFAPNADAKSVKLSGFSANATLVGTPLSSDQSEQLVQAIANASDGYNRGHSAGIYNVDWSKADLAARAILSPDQFNTFSNLESQTGSNTTGRQLIQLCNSISAAIKADTAGTR